MKFNTLFNPTYGYVRSIAGILLGAALIVWPEVAPKTIVQIIGCFLIVVGIISFVLSLKKNKAAKDDKVGVDLLSINGIFDMVFGAILLIIPNVFVTFLMIVLGLMLFVFGVGEIIGLISARKVSLVPWWMFVLPVIVLIGGVVIMFNPFQSAVTLFIFFGVSLVVYGISELISTIKLRKVIKYKQSFEYRVEDAPYEEVKSDK